MLTHVLLSKGLASHLADNQQGVKVMALFLGLKGLYVGGYIKNFSKRAKELAAHCGVCERTFRTYLRILKEEGLVEKVNTHDLRLISSRKVAELHQTSTKKYHKVPVSQSTHFQEYLEVLAYGEKQDKMTYARDRKLEADYLLTKGITNPNHLQPAARKRVLRGYNQEVTLAIATTRFRKEVSTPMRSGKLPTNPYITLSREGIARLRGKQYHNSGLYAIRKWKELGYIQEELCQVDCGVTTPAEVALLRSLGIVDWTFRCQKGRLVKSLPNLVSVSLPIV